MQLNHFKSLRKFGLAALPALCLALRATSETRVGNAYLATAGPAPLRFLAVATPSTNSFKPPAVETTPITAIPQKAAETRPVQTVQTINAASVVNEISSQPPSPPAEQVAPQEPPPNPDGVISPQMLMRYFNKSNGITTTVAAPVDFSPPKPAVAPASKATFSTGP